MSSYKVLARTWRPQKFAQVVGQDHIVQTLKNIVSGKRVGHAYLFAGTRGVGKTSVARIFAKALNCEETGAIEPCDKCASCREISSSSSIDVVEIDGASNNGVNSIRELREKVGYLPVSGKYKVYIIDEVHMLTENAFNALLKTLEEPPSHVIFIFATTEVHEIPATILSRCQRFNFRKVSRKEISAHLFEIVKKENISISSNGISLISGEAGGSIRDGLSLLEQVVSFSGKDVADSEILDAIGLVDQGLINKTVESLFSNDAGGILDSIRSISEYGYDPGTFLSSLLQQVRNLLVIKVHMDSPSLNSVAFQEYVDLPEEELEELKEIADGMSGAGSIHRVFSIINNAAPEILSSVIPMATLEGVLLRAATIKKGVSAASLLKRLEDIEGKVLRAAPVASKSMSGSSGENLNSEKVKKKEDRIMESSSEVMKWESYVAMVRKRKPILAANMEEGTVTEISDDRVTLVFKNDSFSYKQLTDRENRQEIENILRDNLNCDFRINILLGNPDEGDAKKKINLQQIKKEKIERGINNIKETAMNHPGVNMVKNILEGEVVNVTIKEDNEG